MARGAHVISLGGAQVNKLRRLPLILRGVTTVVGEGKRRPFDVLHALWGGESGFVTLVAARALNVPTVVSLLGGELVAIPDIDYGGRRGRLNGWLTSFSIKRADRVTVGSKTMRQLAKPYVAARRLTVVPLGIDVRMFRPADSGAENAPWDKECLNLLHVASLVPVKDQDCLLEAFAKVAASESHAHLHIVGEGPRGRELKQLVERRELRERVSFHGQVAHHDLPTYYRAADLVVLSSRFESQGMVILEAAACGCPSVGTAVGVLPDLGDAAVIVPVGDARALASATTELLREKARRRAVAQTALARVRRNYSVEQAAATFESMYKGLCTPIE
jgi:glycosyltransferase involved in cell wall biosynthesis